MRIFGTIVFKTLSYVVYVKIAMYNNNSLLMLFRVL